MKRIRAKSFALMIILALVLPLAACCQTRLLTNFPSGQGVEKVYISKTMLKMGGLASYNFLANLNIKSVNGIEVYSCENRDLMPEVKKKMAELIQKYDADIIIEAQETNETSLIYALYEGEDRKDSVGMAIVSEENNAINIVIFHGKVDMDN